jgi:hypothetical protein
MDLRYLIQVDHGVYSVSDWYQISKDHSNSPIGRTNSPVGRTNSPVGRTNSPVGRTNSPVGRTNSPVERTNSPIGGTFSTSNPRKSPVSKVLSIKESKVKQSKEAKVEKEELTTQGILAQIATGEMPTFVSNVKKVWAMFREPGFSPDLLHRMAFALMHFDGFTDSTLAAIFAEGNKALKSTNPKVHVSERWMLVSRRIQTIYEDEGYVWIKCRRQNTAWVAEERLAKLEDREPRLELFPMEAEKQQQNQDEVQKQNQKSREDELAEQVRQEIIASGGFRARIKKPLTDAPLEPAPVAPIPAQPAAAPPTRRPAVNSTVKPAAKLQSQLEAVNHGRLKQFVDKAVPTKPKQKIDPEAEYKRLKEQHAKERGTKIVDEFLSNARIVPSPMPIVETDDNACFLYPEKFKKRKA